jgi:hypothetical protein
VRSVRRLKLLRKLDDGHAVRCGLPVSPERIHVLEELHLRDGVSHADEGKEPQRCGRVPPTPGTFAGSTGRAGAPTLEAVGRLLVRRLLFTVFVLFVVSLITFVIFVKLPASDPARRAAGKATTDANIEAAREAFGLNRPVYVQYARFASGHSSWRSRTCASTSCTPTSIRACGSRRGSAAQALRATPRPELPSSPRSITMPSTISTMPIASTPPVTVVNSFWAIA